MDFDITTLDQNQKKAVLHTEGAILVLAGAGSGKTRVLTHRIARLIKEKHCLPEQILAVTFTNKAAREMKERIAKISSKKSAEAMTICTFHSLGARILREFGSEIGLSPQFTILDDNDRLSTLQSILRATGKSKETIDEIGYRISIAKNGSTTPDEYKILYPEFRKTSMVYKAYTTILLKRNCVDFDDLILLPLQLFREKPQVLEKFKNRYKFISIDEFQDTNRVQMEIVKLIGSPANNILAVGDDDQSIYSWRGAEIGNILSFTTTFSPCKSVILDKNYRSTRQIVDAAAAVINHNERRKAKKIHSAAGQGAPILTYKGDDETEEAVWVTETIVQNVKQQKFSLNQQALLFRTNALMRRFEEELRIQRVPYHVQGSMSFFERKEVKDVLAYLRFFANTADELSLARVLKVPNKGITKTTMDKIEELAGFRRMSLWEALERHEEVNTLPDEQHARIKRLVEWHAAYCKLYQSGQLSVTTRTLLKETGYLELLTKAYANDASLPIRLENIEELIHGLELYEKRHPDGGCLLARYLQECSLLASEESTNDEKKNAVTLMTIHKAKGLEFPAVFLPGLDDALFPSPQSCSEGRIDEERRLFYVAMTRAQRLLIITFPKTKLHYKKSVTVTPCRFLREIPEEFLDGKIGEKQDQEYETFTQNFFADMKKKLG